MESPDGRGAAVGEARRMSAPVHARRLAALTLAAAVLVAAAIVLTRPDSAARVSAAPPPSAVAPRFAGLAQRWTALGDPGAPATLTEFADLQCPFCGDYARDVLPSVVGRYVRTGRVRLDFEVLAFIGPDSVRAARMAMAAAAQDRLWPFVGAFYAGQGQENSGYVTDAFLARAGRAAGLDVTAALAQRHGPAARRALAAAARAAKRLRVRSTPSFWLRVRGRAPVEVVPRELTPPAFASALDRALAAH